MASIELIEPLLEYCDIKTSLCILRCSKDSYKIVSDRIQVVLSNDKETPILKLIKLITYRDTTKNTLKDYKDWFDKIKARDPFVFKDLLYNTDMITDFDMQNFILKYCFPLENIKSYTPEQQVEYMNAVNQQICDICKGFIERFASFGNDACLQVMGISVVSNVYTRYIEWLIKQNLQGKARKQSIIGIRGRNLLHTILKKLVYFRNHAYRVYDPKKRNELTSNLKKTVKLMKAWQHVLDDSKNTITYGPHGGVYITNGIDKKYIR